MIYKTSVSADAIKPAIMPPKLKSMVGKSSVYGSGGAIRHCPDVPIKEYLLQTIFPSCFINKKLKTLIETNLYPLSNPKIKCPAS